MTIIRGEIVNQTALLSSTGELFKAAERQSIDLIAEERRKSFQKGRDQGEKIGYQKALEESKLLKNLLQTMAEKILEQKKHLLEQLKPEIIEFAITVCEHVIRKELENPETLKSLIHSLLTLATSSLKTGMLQIFLAPDDYEMLGSCFDQMHVHLHKIEEIRFIPDPLMQRGDCRIESKIGLLNYDISRKLEQLQTKVLQR